MSQNQLEIVVDPAKPIVTMRRAVNAPRAVVWDCYTKPEHIRRWKAPRDLAMLVCECDVRVGGLWRAVYRRPNGEELTLHGEFREVVAPERFVRTFLIGSAADATIETLSLAESGPGKTTITTKFEYRTMAIRDAVVAQGPASAMGDTFDRLDELVASFR